MPRRTRFLVLLIALLAVLPPGGAGALRVEDTVGSIDLTRVPGVEAAVGRAFDAIDPAPGAIVHLESAALAFPDARHAATALPAIVPALPGVVRRDATPAAPPALGDEARAWTAAGPGAMRTAIVIVRVEAVVLAYVAVAEGEAPLAPVTGIAAGTLARQAGGAATPAAVATPVDQRPLTSGGMWDLLPRYGDLPGAHALYAEEAWPGSVPD